MVQLFDTFTGFDEEEAVYEMNAGHCDQKFVDVFKNTGVEYVLNKMKYKEKCVVRKGLFPQTTKGIETKFKFVSIDVDFEKSIYASLEYFYPRLIKGGFLFIHDYTSQLKGVRYAVERYEKTFGTVVKVPIADKGGSLLVTK